MHWEPDVGFDPGSPGSRPGPKAGAKPLRHPGIPILYLENPKASTPRLLELIQQFGSVARYKINAQKSVAFLYTNNETEEREIKEEYVL